MPPLMPSKSPGQELPNRDAANFRSMVKLYEEKRYKKAIKIADQILKKCPEHAETISLKGVISWYIPERKSEALDLAKKGLRSNLSNPTCWHILGIIHRNAREFNEAMRCFQQAVRLEGSNQILVRDLITLQIHESNATGFLETRKSLFFDKPGVKANWTSYAFAQHLNGHYLLAMRLLRTTLNHFERISGGAGVEDRWEKGELLLYEAFIHEEAGFYSEGVKLLQACTDVADRMACLEALGRMLIYTAQYDEAHKVYVQLFNRLRANRHYLLCAVATHPAIRDAVEFPKTPAQLRAETKSQTHAVPVPSKQTDSTKKEKLMALSLYALGAPELNGSLSHGWLAHPQHLLFQNPDKNTCNSRPSKSYTSDLVFRQFRQLTAEEESLLSIWFLTDIFDSKGQNSNDSALNLLLDLISDEKRFLFFLDKLIRPKILKGAPFFINILNGTSRDPFKAGLIKQLLTTYLNKLEGGELLGEAPEAPAEVSAEECQKCKNDEIKIFSASLICACRVVCLASLASLFDFMGLKTEALETVEQAIELTPTLLELYQLKARILKHLGNRRSAADAICEAREMDLADRFLNTKAVKYVLDVDEIEQGCLMALYFSKEDNLAEMQSSALEIRRGECHRRLSKPGLALKQFYLVLSHFKDMKADLYDFHIYCQRRGSFRSYLQTLRMRNQMCAQGYFRRATTNVIEILLDQFDKPVEAPIAPAASATSSASKKKKKKAETPPPVNQSTPVPETEQDPQGLKLLLTGEAALKEASSLVDQLAQVATLWPTTHRLAFQVAERKGEVLIMLQSLHRSWKLSGERLDSSFAAELFRFIANVMPCQPKPSVVADVPSSCISVVAQNVLVKIFRSFSTEAAIESCDWIGAQRLIVQQILSLPKSGETLSALLSIVKAAPTICPMEPVILLARDLQTVSLRQAEALAESTRANPELFDAVKASCSRIFPQLSKFN